MENWDILQLHVCLDSSGVLFCSVFPQLVTIWQAQGPNAEPIWFKLIPIATQMPYLKHKATVSEKLRKLL